MAIVEQERVREKERLAEPDPVLLRAAEIVQERWRQGGSMMTPGGSRCALQAIEEATGGRVLSPSHDAFCASLGTDDYAVVYRWNDAPERTQEEVATALERAAYGL